MTDLIKGVLDAIVDGPTGQRISGWVAVAQPKEFEIFVEREARVLASGRLGAVRLDVRGTIPGYAFSIASIPELSIGDWSGSDVRVVLRSSTESIVLPLWAPLRAAAEVAALRPADRISVASFLGANFRSLFSGGLMPAVRSNYWQLANANAQENRRQAKTCMIAWSQAVSHFSPINPPENTLDIVPLGFALGFDSVEVDVQRTKDDQLVLMHDHTLDRTTDSRGLVAQYTAKELSSVTMKGWGGAYTVPLLSDAFRLARGRGRIMLDLREVSGGSILGLQRAISESGFLETDLQILAYEREAGLLLKSEFPRATVMLKFHEVPEIGFDYSERAQGLNVVLVQLANDVNKARSVAECLKSSGIELGVYLHNGGMSLQSLQDLCDAGCRYITGQNHHYFRFLNQTSEARR